jgi:hypothetical protein
MTAETRTEARTADSSWKSATGLGYWSAILTAVFAAASCAIGITTPARSGPFCASSCVTYPYTNVAAFIPADYIWLYPTLLLAPIFVVLIACLHSYAADDRKIFSQIALSFALVYAAVIAVDYFTQFTVVIPSLLSGETAGLSLFTQYDPHGLFVALEGLGYLMMSAAFLFAAGVFSRGRLERGIRWLFLMSFMLAIGSFAGLFWLRYDIVAFEVAILLINWITLIVSGLLLSVWFRRAGRLGSS